MTRQPAQDLRAAIDSLPLATREQMLEAIERHPIIVGADGNLRGGVCPIFALSRTPSKTVGRPFARAWDRYGRARLPRAATERELLTLRSMLDTSIQTEKEPAVPLGAAITEHQVSKARRRAERRATSLESEAELAITLGEAIEEHKSSRARHEAAQAAEREAAESASKAPERSRRDTGERDRTRELTGRPGWSWLRPVRRYDDFERALVELIDQAEQPAPDQGAPDPGDRVPSSAGRS